MSTVACLCLGPGPGPQASWLLVQTPAPFHPQQTQGFCRQYREVIKRIYFGAKLYLSSASLDYQLSDSG